MNKHDLNNFKEYLQRLKWWLTMHEGEILLLTVFATALTIGILIPC